MIHFEPTRLCVLMTALQSAHGHHAWSPGLEAHGYSLYDWGKRNFLWRLEFAILSYCRVTKSCKIMEFLW